MKTLPNEIPQNEHPTPREPCQNKALRCELVQASNTTGSSLTFYKDLEIIYFSVQIEAIAFIIVRTKDAAQCSGLHRSLVASLLLSNKILPLD